MFLRIKIVKLPKKIGEREKKSRIHRAGHKLLFDMLKEHSLLTKDIEIDIDKNGRPFIKGREDLDFNISHTENVVCCVLSIGEGKVGIDVEPIHRSIPEEHRERFVKRFFSDKEKILYRTANDGFVRVWTAKEAYFKCLGSSLKPDIKSIDSSSLPNGMKITVIKHSEYLISICHKSKYNVVEM